MEYYYLSNGHPVGPMTLEELDEVDIERDTLIMRVGESCWLKAYELPELKQKLASVPPPIDPEQTSRIDTKDIEPPKANTTKAESGIINLLQKLFLFKGRATRTEYWIAAFVIGPLSSLLNTLLTSDEGAGLTGLVVIIFILLIWVSLSIGARRCHDLGYNGFFQLIPFFPLVMAFKDSEKGDNKYGENPKGISKFDLS